MSMTSLFKHSAFNIEPHSIANAKEEESRGTDIKYVTGEQAILLDKEDCGFCYYPSGRTAVCISKVNAYQKRYYFYEDNRRKTLLSSVDEHVVGSAGRSGEGLSLVLTKESGFLSDEDRNLIKTWKWDPCAQNAGSAPSEPLKIRLNKSLEFSFVSRQDIKVSFCCNGVRMDFQCGEKLRRTDNYLAHSTKITVGKQRGKLAVNIDSPSLIERQKQVERNALEKRSKQKPKSVDICNADIRSVISNLENGFDSYEHTVQPYMDVSWKKEAIMKTSSEVPSVALTGTEVGPVPSKFGRRNSKSTESVDEKENTTGTPKKRNLKGCDGKWLGSLEIRNMLDEENPILKRSNCLCNASGRYNVDLQLPRDHEIQQGKRLRRVRGKDFQDFLEAECEQDQAVMIACLREDDRTCRQIEKVLELVNDMISKGEYGALSSSEGRSSRKPLFGIAKFEMSESKFMLQRYNVQTVPTFLMFYSAKLVNVTGLGGKALRVTPTISNANLTHMMNDLPRTLLIEPDFKNQLLVEKVLRKEKFCWELAMNAPEAISHATRLSSNAKNSSSVQEKYGIIMISDKISENDAKSIDRCICRVNSNQVNENNNDNKKNASPLVCIILSKKSVPFSSQMCMDCNAATGRKERERKHRSPRASMSSSSRSTKDLASACPHCGIIDEPKLVLPAVFSDMADLVVYKHLKAASLHRFAEKWSSRRDQYTQLQRRLSNPNLTLKEPSKTRELPRKKAFRVREEGTFKGLTRESVLEQLEHVLASGRRGRFLSSDHQVGLMLSAAETSLQGKSLVKPSSARRVSRASRP